MPQVLLSSVTRFVLVDTKATVFPSAPITGLELSPIPWFPTLSTLTSVVIPANLSYTKTSAWVVP